MRAVSWCAWGSALVVFTLGVARCAQDAVSNAAPASVGDDAQSSAATASRQTQLTDIQEDKRAWKDLHSGWGKRGWSDMQSGWGKRGWNDMQSGWGKRGWNDLQSGWGKRGWDDLQSGWGKRGWNDLQSGWGKRGWNDMQSGWGKRGWNDMQSGWGKRGWNDMQGGWGKRSWNNFHGSWGKRTPFNEDSEEMWDLDRLLEDPRVDQFDHLEDRDFSGEEQQLRGKRADWSSFRDKLKRGFIYIGPCRQGNRNKAECLIRGDPGSWGKRVPGWSNLKGLWGKRSAGNWDRLSAAWGKRDSDGDLSGKDSLEQSRDN